VTLPNQWFCALLDTAAEVYFRYALSPRRKFVYMSPSVEMLTGHAPAAFHADANLCLSLVAGQDRPLLRRVLRSRRAVATRLHLVRNDVAIPVELHTVALVKRRRVVAIEGRVRLAVGFQAGGPGTAAVRPAGVTEADAGQQPVQQRLAALMFEVHDLLHRVLPASDRAAAADRPRLLRLANLVLDCDRLVVTDSGQAVGLTSREVMVLRYLLERPGRVVTRQQLLEDVWSYSYTGDDRTVDVHVSRLRRKLPSLAGRLVGIRNIGYRLDGEESVAPSAAGVQRRA
jgi:hypothetical protein